MFNTIVTERTTNIIPAAPGYLQLRFHFRTDVKVTIDNVMAGVQVVPIVAWRVAESGRADPITIEDPPGANTAVAILCGSQGKVIEPGVASWPNYDAWMQTVLLNWRELRKAAAA